MDLSWSASASAIGYNVYRGTAFGGPYVKVNPALVTGTSYRDLSVLAGQFYSYVATAVGSDNAESGYSNETSGVVPSK